MKVVRGINEMQDLVDNIHTSQQTIGLVPTMGALHKGHLSLLAAARKQTDITVVSIFVNPTQFGINEDFDQYPRPFDQDCEKAAEYGCDILFSPQAKAMYPENYMTYCLVENITKKFEGRIRPGHFRGVTTVVLKLFNIIQPHKAFFGQKDAQQTIVLQRLIKDLNLRTKLLVMPTIRESDGLALSSRNAYLTAQERKQVPIIFQGLGEAQKAYSLGKRNTRSLKQIIKKCYAASPIIQPEYVAIVDLETLKPLHSISDKALIAVACKTKESHTRLIDNIILDPAI